MVRVPRGSRYLGADPVILVPQILSTGMTYWLPCTVT